MMRIPTLVAVSLIVLAPPAATSYAARHSSGVPGSVNRSMAAGSISVRARRTGPSASPGTTGVPCSEVEDVDVAMATVNTHSCLTVNTFKGKTTHTQIGATEEVTVYAEERQQAIAASVARRGRLSVAEIAARPGAKDAPSSL